MSTAFPDSGPAHKASLLAGLSWGYNACTYHSFALKHACLSLLLLVLFSSCNKSFLVLNKGIAGNNSNDLVKRIDRDVLSENPDLVILMVGSNDMINSKKFISYASFQANYQQLLNQLKFRDIEVVVMSPPPADTGYVFQRHNRELFSEDPNSKLDSLNGLIRQLARANQVHYIDINQAFKQQGSPNRQAHSLIVNQTNMGIADGLHPTREGYRLIAREIYQYLKQHKLLKKNRRIICFGDSITYGAFMDGRGTSQGDTYPAYLQRLLLPARKHLLR
jgi:lysophospholipase L1-like esterase